MIKMMAARAVADSAMARGEIAVQDDVRRSNRVSPQPRYTVRLARSTADIRAAQTLRFLVFNLELNEGLPQSFDTCLDEDPFDAACDHLVAEETATGEIVGTYRLQTGSNARARLGYYSEQEFDFVPYEPLRPVLLELGRACVHQKHRNLAVLRLLWRGIAAYAGDRGARYLIGCSSMNGTDPGHGAALSRRLAAHLAPVEFRTAPRPGYDFPVQDTASDQEVDGGVDIPKLLGAYLMIGAWICGAPAMDRAFGTIDFLTLLDLDRLSPRFLGKP